MNDWVSERASGLVGEWVMVLAAEVSIPSAIHQCATAQSQNGSLNVPIQYLDHGGWGSSSANHEWTISHHV